MTESVEQFRQAVFDKILEFGHVVQYVAAERPCAYTVGRTMKQRPELLLTGPFTPNDMKRLLNDAVRLDDEEPIIAGKWLHGVTPGEYPMKPIEADPHFAEMFVARDTFGDVEVIQLLWPDKEGRYPDEPDCTVSGLQPIYRKE